MDYYCYHCRDYYCCQRDGEEENKKVSRGPLEGAKLSLEHSRENAAATVAAVLFFFLLPRMGGERGGAEKLFECHCERGIRC